jgi:hypothetical protein
MVGGPQGTGLETAGKRRAEDRFSRRVGDGRGLGRKVV